MLDFLALGGAGRSEVEDVHHILAARDGTAGEAAGDDLGHDAKIRRHAQRLLCAARCPAEAGDYLVENQKNAAP